MQVTTFYSVGKITEVEPFLKPHCKKMPFLLNFLVLFSAKISKTFLNQEGFSRQVQIIVLFSEILSEFLLRTSKIMLFQTENKIIWLVLMFLKTRQ